MIDEKEYISIRVKKAREMDSRDFDIRYDRETPLEEIQKKPIQSGYCIENNNNLVAWSLKEEFEAVYREITDKDREFLRGLEDETK